MILSMLHISNVSNMRATGMNKKQLKGAKWETHKDREGEMCEHCLYPKIKHMPYCTCKCHKPSKQECKHCGGGEIGHYPNCPNGQPPKSSDLTNGKSTINKSASKSGKLINKHEKADLTLESSEGWKVDFLRKNIHGEVCESHEIIEYFDKLLSQQQKEVEERIRKELRQKMKPAFDDFRKAAQTMIKSGKLVRTGTEILENVGYMESVLTSIEEKGGRG